MNCHPALLPRHRGPIPLAWAFRDGDAQFGVTWHRMDAELDTGPILAQATVPMEDDDFGIGRRRAAHGRGGAGPAAAGAGARRGRRPGDPQPSEGVTWAGHFGEDYVTVDWTQPARHIHDQVRAWRIHLRPRRRWSGRSRSWMAAASGSSGTCATDPGGDARRLRPATGRSGSLEVEAGRLRAQAASSSASTNQRRRRPSKTSEAWPRVGLDQVGDARAAVGGVGGRLVAHGVEAGDVSWRSATRTVGAARGAGPSARAPGSA